MIDNLDILYIQALNPLYAIPIVAVILCVFIVYAFGFKSPLQPPSFEGIEEEKKYSKKRRGKDNSKNKLIQNGKINGSVSNKNQISTSKKKDLLEKHANEKPLIAEKTVEKKAGKKTRQQNEKKSVPDRKKDFISHEDVVNDDGWVQLISKKGRKNRKKDDVNVPENQNTTKSKVAEENKHENSPVEESPKESDDYAIDNSVLYSKQPPFKHSKNDMQCGMDVLEKVSDQVVVEVSKPDSSNPEKVSSKSNVIKDGKFVEEGSNKSKKRKKKGGSENTLANESVNNLPESSAMQMTSEISVSQEKISSSIAAVSGISDNSGKIKTEQAAELKSPNVAFDELTGLYPEAKEQKKKKKVRRDH